MKKEVAHTKLVEITGVDFGENIEEWKIWGESHPEITTFPPPSDT